MGKGGSGEDGQIAVQFEKLSFLRCGSLARGGRFIALSTAVLIAGASTVFADDNVPVSSFSDRAAGVLAGLLLLSLVLYALYSGARPLIREGSSGLWSAVFVLLALWIIKSIAVTYFPGFKVDVGTFEAWGFDISQNGPSSMYRAGSFLDYPPGYLYALWAAGSLARLTGASDAMLRIIIETPALAADFLLAALMFIIVRRRSSVTAAWIAMLFFALNPALLFDTVIWGQSDSTLALTLMLAIVSILDDEIELGWGLAALAFLIKPQAMMLLPVLGLWTLRKMTYGQWFRSALAFIAVLVVGIAPFQVNHPWTWLPDLYISTAAYYHETSVNAFNFIALLGGLRRNDADPMELSYFTVALVALVIVYAMVMRYLWRKPSSGGEGANAQLVLFGPSAAFVILVLAAQRYLSDMSFSLSYFTIGMSLLVPLYAIVAWVIFESPTRRNLFMMAFIALFGFFILAPRMHERYLYPAVVFAIPLALEEPPMLGVFIVVTLTGVFNLAYILHTLNTVVFLDGRDGLAMTTAVLNCGALLVAAYFGFSSAREATDGAVPSIPGTAGKQAAKGPVPAPEGQWSIESLVSLPKRIVIGPPPAETYERFPWIRIDTISVILLTAVAGFLRFWHISHPPEIVFDEVHFVGQARHYLHNETFLDPHPPVAKLVIAAGIALFGDHPASWRYGNAILGTLMIAVTYLLGRRMFKSRLAAFLGAGLIALDGYFVVDSRIACIDIVYLTLASICYLLLFRFIQTPEQSSRRLILIPLGIILGLCVGAKLYIPALTFLVVMGFIAFTMWRPQIPAIQNARSVPPPERDRFRRTFGALMLTGSLSAIFYLASFTPHYTLGWWGGISDLFHYYKDVIWYENSVSTATHPYASPWWSWPLMLRPVAYWQNFPQTGDVSTIWGAGNPLTWWGAIAAMAVTAVRAVERPSITRTFMVVSYLAYFLIWIPIGRILFLYHYMPSVYIGYLALGALLADLWTGEAEFWEGLVLLLTMFPVLIVGVGHMVAVYKPTFVPESFQTKAGLPIIIAVVAAYVVALRSPRNGSRFVFFVFTATALALFFYYLPVWLGTPIAREGYYARMWLQGPGLQNWI